MTQQESDIVNKLWGYCNVLKADGMHYGDYIEQLTYLLFLKMADERGAFVPEKYKWNTLLEHSGTDLLEHYSEMLRELGKQEDVLGDIFSQSNNKFRNPVNLSKLILLINENDWGTLDIDVKGTAYEGLLAKFAADQKGAGQYFTPRELIKSIVKCVAPKHNETIHDPACGTGGFLIGAFEHIFSKLEKENKALSIEEQEFLQKKAISGGEIVWDTRRLCIMNLYLHDIEADIRFGDALEERYGSYDVIVTNPPFGTKSGGSKYTRDDFTVQTSNKQLNFLQHCMSILKIGGRCAMVMPDNVLFEDNDGQKIRKILLENNNLHTILRLPDGVFTPYAAGVKTNVLFFEKTGKRTEEVWIYDMRTNVEKITKTKGLTKDYFKEFEEAYKNRNEETERWKKFTYEDIQKRNFNLDITWIKDNNSVDYKETILPENIYKVILQNKKEEESLINEIQGYYNKIKTEIVEVNTTSSKVKIKDILTESFGGVWGEKPNGTTDIKILRSTNISQDNKVIDLENVAIRSISSAQRNKYLLVEGDIIMTKSSGSPRHIGKSILIDKALASQEYSFANFMHLFRVDREKANPLYVFLFLSREDIREKILKASTTTTGLRNLKIDAIKDLEIPLPNLHIQIDIAKELENISSIIDKLKHKYSFGIEEAENYKQSILHIIK